MTLNVHQIINFISGLFFPTATLGHRNKILRGVQALRNPLWQHFANEDDISMPDELFCPITHELMKDPVVASGKFSMKNSNQI